MDPSHGNFRSVGTRGARCNIGAVACCQFCGHEDKIVMKKLKNSYDERNFNREFKTEDVRLMTDPGSGGGEG